MSPSPAPGRAGAPARYRAPVDESPVFSVTADPADPQCLRATGELDATTAPVLREALTALADAPGAVVLDLEAVTFIDSSGLQSITAALRTRREAGNDLRVAGASRSVRRIFEVTGLTELLAEG